MYQVSLRETTNVYFLNFLAMTKWVFFKSEDKFGSLCQTLLPFAFANGSNVWPVLRESLAAFALKEANFTEKTQGNYEKVWPPCPN